MNLKYFFKHRFLYKENIYKAENYDSSLDAEFMIQPILDLNEWAKSSCRIWKRNFIASSVLLFLNWFSFFIFPVVKPYVPFTGVLFTLVFVISLNQFLNWSIQDIEYNIILYKKVYHDITQLLSYEQNSDKFIIRFEEEIVFDGPLEQYDEVKADLSKKLTDLFLQKVKGTKDESISSV